MSAITYHVEELADLILEDIRKRYGLIPNKDPFFEIVGASGIRVNGVDQKIGITVDTTGWPKENCK